MYGLGLRSLSRDFAATFMRQLGAVLLGLVTAAIIARVYGPEGNGVFAISLLLPNMLSTLYPFVLLNLIFLFCEVVKYLY